MDSPDAVAKELQNAGRLETIEKLHRMYSVSDRHGRLRILELLNELGDDEHFQEIESYFISDEDTEVRIEAGKNLAMNYKTNKAIKPLIWVLENEKNNETKYSVLNLLVAMSYREEFRPTIVETLKKLLKSTDDKLKMIAAESLGIMEEQSVIDDLIELLKSPNKLVLIKAIQSLGNLKNNKAAPFLIDRFKLESFDVWKYIYDSLISILGAEMLTDLLLEVLRKTDDMDDTIENSMLKRSVIKALGELGDKRAIPQLIDGLKEYWASDEAQEALNKINSNWQEEFKEIIKKKNINL